MNESESERLRFSSQRSERENAASERERKSASDAIFIIKNILSIMMEWWLPLSA
jgi:hypothetical protein